MPTRNDTRSLILRAFKKHGCVDCGAKAREVGGELDWAELHCDHLDPSTKAQTVCAGGGVEPGSGPANATRGSAARLVEELMKCEVVCQRCHAIRTKSRRNGHRQMHLPARDFDFGEILSTSQPRLFADARS